MSGGAAVFLAHLPQVALEATETQYHVNYGTLVELDFDNWAMLEGHGSRDWQSYFSRKHTFFAKKMSADQVIPAELLERAPISYLASGSHFAWYLLWFSTGIFTLHPELSASYVALAESPDKQVVLKAKGYCDNDLFRQDAIVKIRLNDANVLFENAQKLHLNAQHNFILDQFLAPYRKVVALDAQPHQIFSFVSALEQILNPEGQTPLGRAFAARFAVLMATENPGTLDQWKEFGRRLYDLRSRVIHGSGVAKSMDKVFEGAVHRTFLPVSSLRTLACCFAALELVNLSADDLPELTRSDHLNPLQSDAIRFRDRLQMRRLEMIGDEVSE